MTLTQAHNRPGVGGQGQINCALAMNSLEFKVGGGRREDMTGREKAEVQKAQHILRKASILAPESLAKVKD